MITDGSTEDKQVTAQQERCIKDLDAGGSNHVDVTNCEAILQDVLRVTQNQAKEPCINMYDVRLRDTYPSCGMNWPPDLEQVTPYLRRQDVIDALHIDPDKKTGWTECNGNVGSAFRAANSKPSRELLPNLLQHMPIILFSGDQDLICNHLGTEELIANLEWNGARGMELGSGTTAPRRDWTFEGEPAGIYQSARNLTYIKFFNSSHMVPFDYPRRTRDMLDRFLGVDIASIGGSPADSRIDGEKAPSTSVGGHPNSTVAEEAEKDKINAATWAAYKRAGEVALFFVAIAAGAWGWFVFRERRRRAGYKGVFGADPYDDGGRDRAPSMNSGLGLDGFNRNRRSQADRDIEAAADFDENELDNLSDGRHKEMDRERFGLADSDDEGDEHPRRANGHAS